MATWYVRPLPAGGWQVLTPGYTQGCRVRPDQNGAIRAACTRIADEGGGQVAVQTASGQLDQLVGVAASYSPHDAGLSPSG